MESARTWHSRSRSPESPKQSAMNASSRRPGSIEDLSRSQAQGTLRRTATACGHGAGHRALSSGVPHEQALSNLDAKLPGPDQIASLTRRLGVTTVYVTHDQVEAMTMGGRVAVLAEGRLQQRHPRALYDQPPTSSSPASSGLTCDEPHRRAAPEQCCASVSPRIRPPVDGDSTLELTRILVSRLESARRTSESIHSSLSGAGRGARCRRLCTVGRRRPPATSRSWPG